MKPGVLTPLSTLVLTNAIYFKTDWESKFRKEMTRKEAFFLTAHDSVQVDMMHKKEDLNYCKAGDVEVLEIPYKRNELSMVILLPESRDGIKELERSLSAAGLEDLLRSLSKRKVAVSLPRFKTSSELVLNEALQNMGIKNAFKAHTADFSGMTGTRKLFISAAIHKAFVAVDEEGTEASAATAVAMSRSMPPEFRVDHPFIFLIRDNTSASILFMGHVMDPRK